MTDTSMCWFALQELSATNLANKLTIASLYLPPHSDHAWPPASLPSLVRVVVHLRVAALLRERAAIARIVDDQIGVAAELDLPFLGVQSEQLRGLGRTGIHHPLQSHATRGHAAGVDQIHPFLHRRDAVGDLGERVPAHLLLVPEPERCVIGRNRADVPGFHAVPEYGLIGLRAKRWGHHVPGSLERGPRGVRLIQHKMRD